MSGDICTDDRFELIAKAKANLLECTNIESSLGEVAVLDSILFRCWQMGWLDQLRDSGTRYHELFGTPERAARTIMGKQLTYDLLTQCDDCPYQTDECYKPSGKCAMDEYDTLLGWLRGDAE